MSAIGLVHDPVFLEHDTGDHPENSSRLVAIGSHLRQAGLLDRLIPIAPRPAALDEIERIHTRALVRRVERIATAGGGALDWDTVVSAGSYHAARMAAGGLIAATEATLEGRVRGAMALVRPPGHHATREQAMGFCLFNNVAIAATWALARPKVERVAIVDFDVHHGNGTAEAFAEDPRVLFVSTHQYPFYPGTGHWRDRGEGEGEGTTLNISLPAETGDQGYAAAFERLIEPALRRFAPDLMLVSAGYDAHWADPLSWMLMSLTGYYQIAGSLVRVAEAVCGGRLVGVLEGGYNAAVLSGGVEATLRAMLGEPFSDALGPAREPEVPLGDLLDRIAAWHDLA